MNKRQQYINLFAFAVFVSLILFLTRRSWIWYGIPCALLVAGLLSSMIRQAILWLWLKFSHLLGTVNTALILCLIYFVIITPYAVLFRKKTSGLYVLRKPSVRSFFKDRMHEVTKEDFEKSW